MRPFLWNLVLTAAWVAFTGRLTVANVALGFALGYAILWLSAGVFERTSYFRKVWQLLRFAGFFLWELSLSTLRVSHDVVTRTHHMRPAVLGIPLDAETDGEITLLANVITLTPGTLTLDVSKDRRTLYIHAMYVDDVERTRLQLKRGYERRVLELLR